MRLHDERYVIINSRTSLQRSCIPNPLDYSTMGAGILMHTILCVDPGPSAALVVRQRDRKAEDVTNHGVRTIEKSVAQG